MRKSYLRKKRRAKKHQVITMGKENRIRDDKHREWIASLPCVSTGLEGNSQCAHISEGRNSMGLKAGDDNCVSLSVDEHRFQHEVGENVYWLEFGGISKVRRLANRLYEISGQTELAIELIEEFRNGQGSNNG